jgi:lipoprotein-anchoring transpeptidase ErfK/SrfK
MDEDAFDGLSPLERVRSFGYQAKIPGATARRLRKDRWQYVASPFYVSDCSRPAARSRRSRSHPTPSMTPRDKKLLANAPYAQATIPEPYKRHIVTYHRKETAGAIVVDSDARYLYYVLPEGKAIRYGITVGEDALAFSGIAKVGRKEEWPSWTPTNDIKKRLGNIPGYVAPGPHNPMGSRALYVYDGPKDTLYRIHGTNQPEYIGSAISRAASA